MRLIVYFLLVSIIPLIFFGYLGYSNAKRSLTEKEEKKIKLLGENTKERMTKFFCIAKRDILFLKGITEGCLSHSDEEIKDELENIYYHFSKENLQYDQIEFINKEGYTTIRISNNTGEAQKVSYEEFQYKGYDNYLKEALKLKNGEIYISDINFNYLEGKAEKSFKPMIRYITPIYENNDLKGFLSLSINIKYLLNDIEKLSAESKYKNMILMNKDGYYLMHINKANELSGVRDLKIDESFKKDYPEIMEKVLSSKIQKMESDKKSIFYWYPIELKCLNNKKMIIFMDIDRKDYLQSVNVFRYYFIFHVAITLLIIIVSIVIISFYLTKPIINIVKAVEGIGKGHFDVDLNINTGDELELLSCRIKKMTYELKNMYRNMEEQVNERTRELKRAHEKLEEMATKDSLTGLYNRHYFNQYIQNIDESKYTNLMILIIDVDRFKYINDNYGHNIGDIVLKEIAKILKNSARESDLTVRYGGDEFLVALYGKGKELVESYINRVEQSFNEWNKENDILDYNLTLSIGYDEYTSDKYILETISNADKMMYENKMAKRKNKG